MSSALRKCDQCGREFTPRNSRQRFCCRECQLAWKAVNRPDHHRDLEPRTCEFCGAAFTPHDPRQRFCSRRCAKKAYDAAHHPPLPPRKCELCGAVFTPARPDRRYCSKRCGNIAYLRARAAARLKPRTCPWCGATFQPRRRDQMFCSKKCGRLKRLYPAGRVPARKAVENVVDIDRVQAYLLLEPAERYARRGELTAAELKAAERLFNDRSARDMSCWHQCWGA